MDLDDFQEREKYMNIFSHAEGFVLKLEAHKKAPQESASLYALAIDRFKKALSSNPDNKNSLRNLADCYEFVGEFYNVVDARFNLYFFVFINFLQKKDEQSSKILSFTQIKITNNEIMQKNHGL